MTYTNNASIGAKLWRLPSKNAVEQSHQRQGQLWPCLNFLIPLVKREDIKGFDKFFIYFPPSTLECVENFYQDED